MQLHCLKDGFSDSISADFQNLNKFNEQQFHRLEEILFQFLLEPKETERFVQHLSEFAGDHGMSFGPLRNLMKSVLLVPQGEDTHTHTHTHTLIPVFCSGALKRNLTAEQIKEDLLTLGLSEDKATSFSQQWDQNRSALSQLVIRHTLMVNQLLDMEWKFGVTVGTSEIHKVGNIFLQLKFVVRKGNSTENIFTELTLPQFYNFLHEMERVKACMECFS
ncbi:COMM domain-containing protein 7 isoform X1 [Gouania willdenowi]|uniref:COMM domain-containing protein 7 isoform X1 n=1 Tax=Gouania willdenowi TaxID=441366 RepID=UPI001055C52E|nr:COMM domain-containing protein 7 isoform X1 [Gouania willdenowi]